MRARNGCARWRWQELDKISRELARPDCQNSMSDLVQKPMAGDFSCPPRAYAIKRACWRSSSSSSASKIVVGPTARRAASASVPGRGRCEVSSTTGPLPARTTALALPIALHAVSVRASPFRVVVNAPTTSKSHSCPFASRATRSTQIPTSRMRFPFATIEKPAPEMTSSAIDSMTFPRAAALWRNGSGALSSSRSSRWRVRAAGCPSSGAVRGADGRAVPAVNSIVTRRRAVAT